jgi:hypothetical protein
MDSDGADDGGRFETIQDDDFDSSPRPAKRRKTTVTTAAKAKKQPAPRKTAATKKSTTKKKVVNDDPIIDGEEDAFDPPVIASKPKRKPRVSKKASIKDDASLLGDSDDTIGRSTTKAKRNSRKLVSTGSGSGSDDVDDEDDKKAVKPKHRIHVPAMQDLLMDRFADEEPPESSAPWSIRGPIWKKDALVPKQSPVVSMPARQPSLLKSTLNHSALRNNDGAQNRDTPIRNSIPAVDSDTGHRPAVEETCVQDVFATTPTTHSDAWGDLSDDIDSELLMGLVADQHQKNNNTPKVQPFFGGFK